MILKVKKLYDDENIVIPRYMTPYAAGFDISSIEDIIIYPYVSCREVILVKTGLVFEIPKGHEINIRARSGLSIRYPNYFAIAGGGTIDADYRGEIKIPIVNHTCDKWVIKKQERIAQCIVNEVKHPVIQLTETLSDTERSIGGFGSTGS